MSRQRHSRSLTVSLYGAPAGSFGMPEGNYGVGGLALAGTIIQPASPFTGYAAALRRHAPAVHSNPPATQGGAQRIQYISIDGTNALNGNNMHGIAILNAVACVTLRDVLIYGSNGHLPGDGIHAVTSPSNPPDLINAFSVHASEMGNYGIYCSGVADSYWNSCESTGNQVAGWYVLNGNNTRFIGCKGEQTKAGPGWYLDAATGFTGILHLLACTSQDNFEDGFFFTGTGTGTYQLLGRSSDGDGSNGGAGGGGYAGIRLSGFDGVVLADGFNIRLNSGTTSPQYGASATSSNTLAISNANLAGETSPLFNGGTVTSFTGPTLPGGYLRSPSVYAPSTLTTFTTSSATYAAVSSANINTGSFAAPASRSVVVMASFVCSQSTTSTIGFARGPRTGARPRSTRRGSPPWPTLSSTGSPMCRSRSAG